MRKCGPKTSPTKRAPGGCFRTCINVPNVGSLLVELILLGMFGAAASPTLLPSDTYLSLLALGSLIASGALFYLFGCTWSALLATAAAKTFTFLHSILGRTLGTRSRIDDGCEGSVYLDEAARAVGGALGAP